MSGLFAAAATARANDVQGACAVLTAAKAVKLLGGPLGEVMRTETRPVPENGQDHQAARGYFPKGE